MHVLLGVEAWLRAMPWQPPITRRSIIRLTGPPWRPHQSITPITGNVPVDSQFHSVSYSTCLLPILLVARPWLS